MERPDKGPVHSSEKMGPATFTRKRKDRLSLTWILYNLFAPKVGPMNELPASYETDPFPQQSASDLQKHRPGLSAWPQSSTNRKGRDPVFHRVYHSWTPRNQIRRNGASENASEKKRKKIYMTQNEIQKLISQKKNNSLEDDQTDSSEVGLKTQED